MEKNEVGQLVPGDKVGTLYRKGAHIRAEVDMVDRLTATQVVLASGKRFRRDDGRLVGNPDPYALTEMVWRTEPAFVNARGAHVLQVANYKIQNIKVPDSTSTIEQQLEYARQVRDILAEARDQLYSLGLKLKESVGTGQ